MKEYYVIHHEDLVFKTGKNYLQEPNYYANDIKDACLFPSKEVAEAEVMKLRAERPAGKFWVEKIDEDRNVLEVFDKMKVYLFGYFEDCKYPSEVLQELEIVQADNLIASVKEMIDEERICPETIEDGDYDVNNLTIQDAIQILEDDGYTIEEYEI